MSPDHVYVPRSIIPAFTEALKRAHAHFYPEQVFNKSMEWGKMIHCDHHNRVMRQLEQTVGTVVLGGEVEGDTKIAPTIVTGIPLDDALMEA